MLEKIGLRYSPLVGNSAPPNTAKIFITEDMYVFQAPFPHF